VAAALLKLLFAAPGGLFSFALIVAAAFFTAPGGLSSFSIILAAALLKLLFAFLLSIIYTIE
jgi:hypothetical protein